MAEWRILRNVPVNVKTTPVEIRTKFLLEDTDIPQKQKREERRDRRIMKNDMKGKL
jgi:hypothetical protein